MVFHTCSMYWNSNTPIFIHAKIEYISLLSEHLQVVYYPLLSATLLEHFVPNYIPRVRNILCFARLMGFCETNKIVNNTL